MEEQQFYDDVPEEMIRPDTVEALPRPQTSCSVSPTSMDRRSANTLPIPKGSQRSTSAFQDTRKPTSSSLSPSTRFMWDSSRRKIKSSGGFRVAPSQEPSRNTPQASVARKNGSVVVTVPKNPWNTPNARNYEHPQKSGYNSQFVPITIPKPVHFRIPPGTIRAPYPAPPPLRASQTSAQPIGTRDYLPPLEHGETFPPFPSHPKIHSYATDNLHVDEQIAMEGTQSLRSGQWKCGGVLSQGTYSNSQSRIQAERSASVPGSMSRIYVDRNNTRNLRYRPSGPSWFGDSTAPMESTTTYRSSYVPRALGVGVGNQGILSYQSRWQHRHLP